ncbi:MAG TPA: hypothetical protein PKD54_14050, partial [Pirellulaceae bacterium]|nr:hypothetical protein [Pirellulaceae bacterium]
MAYIVGIDEAGYGPNLGPLVVAGTVWSLDQPGLEGDLYQALQPEVDGNPDTPGLTICDSKRLHQAQRGLARLEENVLAIWSRAARGAPCIRGNWPAEVGCLSGGALALDWQSLQRARSQATFWDDDEAGSSIGPPAHDEWYYLLPKKIELPVAGCLDRIRQGVEAFDRATKRAGVSLVRVAFVEISPRQFNELLTRLESKGTLLTGVSLLLARSLLADCSDRPTHVICDKHGGRNRYGHAIRELLDCRAL